MSAVEPFVFDGEPVRVVFEGAEPCWVAADVARILGYAGGARNAVARLPERMKGVALVNTPGGDQSMTVLTEAGVNRLIMRAETALAERVQDWLAEDVMPAIRKNGSYAETPGHALPASYAEALRELAGEVERREVAEAERDALAPSAKAWDHLASTEGDLSVNEAAKTLSRDHGITIGERRLRLLMRTWRWIYKDASGDWRPYQSQVDCGRLCTRARHHINPKTGAVVLDAPQVRLTPKGLAEAYKRLSTDGHQLAIREDAS